jgi:hypothetical protein
MGSLVLLVVAAVWVAVLVPPLLRSRLENRPNSSVSDFRDQLSSLQRAMPSSRSVSMRSMARPLAPSPLTRPAAGGRPPLRSGVTIASGGSVRSAGQQAAMRADRVDSARTPDPAARGRTHGDPSRSHARPVAGADGVKRRRANILFMLALTAACTVFLAATSSSPGMTYAAVGACIALVAYVVVLAQASAAGARPRRQPVSGAHRHHAAPERAPARRQAAAAPPRYRGDRATHAPERRRADAPLRRQAGAERDQPHRDHHRTEHHRTQQVARRAAAPPRSARRRDTHEVAYDPRPSGTVIGEPGLFGQPREARRSPRQRSSVDWSPAV